jgi:hypothetical protein
VDSPEREETSAVSTGVNKTSLYERAVTASDSRSCDYSRCAQRDVPFGVAFAMYQFWTLLVFFADYLLGLGHPILFLFGAHVELTTSLLRV